MWNNYFCFCDKFYYYVLNLCVVNMQKICYNVSGIFLFLEELWYMELLLEILKSIVLGVIQGITEWLPISSTGHMILFDSFWPLNPSVYSGGRDFVNLVFTVIQLSSIFAVMAVFAKKLNPFCAEKGLKEKKETFVMWKKIFVATLPAVVIGLMFKDSIHTYLYNGFVVALTLILYGAFFIVVENLNEDGRAKISKLNQIDYKIAFLMGIFQAFALIPGTSRSGATILGALLIGCSRSVGAEFSFCMSIPIMIGASVAEIISYFKKHGIGFSSNEWIVLSVGFLVSFVVSVMVIKSLMRFIKSHSFKIFAYYRIVMGLFVLFLMISGGLSLTLRI